MATRAVGGRSKEQRVERRARRAFGVASAAWPLLIALLVSCHSVAPGAPNQKAEPPCTMCNGVCVDTQTDDDNCGECGVICAANAPSTAECTAGRCLVTLAAGQATLGSVVVNADNAYWAEDTGGGAVMDVPLDGGTPTFFTTNQGYLGNVILDATNVYWVTTSDGATNFSIMKAPLAGGEPTTLASGQRVPSPDGIAIDDTTLYWSAGTSLFDGSNLVVMKVPLTGGTPAVLASLALDQSGEGIAVDANNVYLALGGTSANRYSDGSLLKVPLDGGLVTTLVADQALPGSVVVNGGYVYWTTAQNVLRIPADGGMPVALATGNWPQGLVVGATDLYWMEDALSIAGGSVMKMSRDGGTPIALASEQLTLSALTVDQTSVYWTNQGTISGIDDGRLIYGDGTLMKLTPK